MHVSFPLSTKMIKKVQLVKTIGNNNVSTVLGLPDSENGISWSLKCGVLPNQWILAELSLRSISYAELSSDDVLSRCTVNQHLIDNDFDGVVRKWEDNQIISKLLREGCRKMALLAEYDDDQQSVAYKFGKYSGLSSTLAKSMIDLSQHPEKCISRHNVPFFIFSKRNQERTSSENVHCSITSQKTLDTIMTDNHAMMKSQNLLRKYIEKCKECLPGKDSNSTRTLQALLRPTQSVGHRSNQEAEFQNHSHANINS